MAPSWCLKAYWLRKEYLCALNSFKLENNWPTCEREMYAIVHFLKNWEMYMLDESFKMFIDNVTK